MGGEELEGVGRKETIIMIHEKNLFSITVLKNSEDCHLIPEEMVV